MIIDEIEITELTEIAKYGKDGIGYDYFPILEEDYYDFHEIKDAELTFYV